jgi:predicted lipid carrier protein YhbT
VADAPFLSEAWFEQLRTHGAELPERPGASGRVQHVVTGTPDGEVRYVITVADGRTADVAVGGDDSADVTYTNTHADALALAAGELDPSVLFMQGRTKMAGDMGTVLALMPLTRSAEYRALVAPG